MQGFWATSKRQPCSPCSGRRGKSKGRMSASPPSHAPEEGCRGGAHGGLAMPGRAALLREPREKGSECLELFGAEGNELKTMSSSVNIYQMNESRGLKH